MKPGFPFHALRGVIALMLAFAACVASAQVTSPPARTAEAAWRDLQNALQAPPLPSEWKGKEPTQEQIAAYRVEQGRLAGIAADKAKEFIANYPNDSKAAEAKRQYARMLTTAVALGNQERAAELQVVQAERLKDPDTPEDERFNLRSQQLFTEIRNTLKPGDDELAAYEKAARQLVQEFPKQTDPYQLLLSIAANSEAARARALLAEIAAGGAPTEIKNQAKELAAKYDRIGQPLPIKFKATNGQDVDLQKMAGKVVLVDFWATWCGPCVKEIPNVRASYEKLHSKGFEIVGISFDSDRQKLDDFVSKEKMPWVQYYDGKGWGNEIGTKYGINSIPAMWLVDKKGILRDLNARADLEKKVEKLLVE